MENPHLTSAVVISTACQCCQGVPSSEGNGGDLLISLWWLKISPHNHFDKQKIPTWDMAEWKPPYAVIVENLVSWDSLCDPGRLGAEKMLIFKCVTEAGQGGLQLCQQSFGTAGGKQDGGFGWQFRFTQAAAPGHCCWWGNFTTEVCVLNYRDGSLTTRNSSSHCVSCFLNSLTTKSLWHCFLRLRFPAESQNAAVPVFCHCHWCIFTCWLNVH